MNHHKLLFLSGIWLSLTATAANGLLASPAARAEQSAAQPHEPVKSALVKSAPVKNAPRDLAAVMARLVHYPDFLVKIAFEASPEPAQIALAAQYLSDPASISGTPRFQPNILALMQYPGLLNLMATDLVWVDDLAQALSTADAQDLWSALAQLRAAPGIQGQAVYRTQPALGSAFRPTCQVECFVGLKPDLRRTIHSRRYSPGYSVHHASRSGRYRLSHYSVGAVRHSHPWHQRRWHDGSYGHRSRHLNGLSDWQLTLSYGPDHSVRHRKHGDRWLYRQQRSLQHRIHHSLGNGGHRIHDANEHKRGHRKAHRQHHRDHHRAHWHEHRRQHHREHYRE